MEQEAGDGGEPPPAPAPGDAPAEPTPASPEAEPRAGPEGEGPEPHPEAAGNGDPPPEPAPQPPPDPGGAEAQAQAEAEAGPAPPPESGAGPGAEGPGAGREGEGEGGGMERIEMEATAATEGEVDGRTSPGEEEAAAEEAGEPGGFGSPVPEPPAAALTAENLAAGAEAAAATSDAPTAAAELPPLDPNSAARPGTAPREAAVSRPSTAGRPPSSAGTGPSLSVTLDSEGDAVMPPSSAPSSRATPEPPGDDRPGDPPASTTAAANPRRGSMLQQLKRGEFEKLQPPARLGSLLSRHSKHSLQTMGLQSPRKAFAGENFVMAPKEVVTPPKPARGAAPAAPGPGLTPLQRLKSLRAAQRPATPPGAEPPAFEREFQLDVDLAGSPGRPRGADKPFRLGSPAADRRFSLCSPIKRKEWEQLMRVEVTQEDAEPRLRVRGTGLETGVVNIFARFEIAVLNQAALLKPVALKDFAISLREGPSRPTFYISQETESTFMVDWSAHMSGVYRIALQCRGAPVKGSPYTAVVKPALSAANRAYVDGPHEFRAGKQGRLKIFAVDQEGNMKVKGGDVFTVSIEGPGRTQREKITDNKDGTYDITFIPFRSGTYNFFVQYEGVNLRNCPYQVEVHPTDPSAPNTVLSGANATLAMAGYNSLFTITVHDKYKNKLPHGGCHFHCFLSYQTNLDGMSFKVPVKVTDNGDGTYTAAYYAEILGTYELKLRMDNRPCFLGKNRHLIKVSAGHVEAKNCIVTRKGLPREPHLDIALHQASSNYWETAAGTPLEVVVDSRDQYGNALYVDSLTIDPVVRRTDGEPFALCEVAVRDNHDGTYLFSLRTEKAYTLIVALSLYDALVAGGPLEVEVVPGALHVPACKILDPKPGLARSGLRKTFIIQGKDRFGNNVRTGGAAFQFRLVPEAAGLDTLTGEVVDLGDGRYACAYLPTVAGAYAFHVESGAGVAVGGFPTAVTIYANDDTMRAAIRGPGYRHAEAGARTTFVVVALDTYGNPHTRGGEAFRATVRLRELEPGTRHIHALKGVRLAEADREPPVEIADRRDGTYEFSYTATAAGMYFVRIFCSNPCLAAIENPALESHVDAEGTRWYLLPVEDGHTHSGGLCVKYGAVHGEAGVSEGEGTKRAVAGVENGFLFYSCDRFSNRVYHGAEAFSVEGFIEFLPPDVEDDVFLRTELDDRGDGTYRVAYRGTESGDYLVEFSLRGEALPATGVRLRMHPNATQTAACTIVPAAAGGRLAEFEAGVPSAVLLEARDAFGNLQEHGRDKLSMVLMPLHGLRQPKNTIRAQVEYVGGGRHRATIRPTEVGPYEMFAMCRPLDVTAASATGAGKASFTYFKRRAEVVSGESSAAHCLVRGPGLKGTLCGVPGIVYVAVCDALGNICSGPVPLAAEVLDSDGGPAGSTTLSQPEAGESIFLISYRVTAKGRYRLQVTLGGADIRGSPFPLEIRPEDMPRADLGPAHAHIKGISQGPGSGSFDWDPDTGPYWARHQGSIREAARFTASTSAASGAGRAAVAYLQKDGWKVSHARLARVVEKGLHSLYTSTADSITSENRFERHLHRRQSSLLHWKIHGLQRSYDLELLDKVGHPAIRRRSVDIAAPEVLGRRVKVPAEKYGAAQRYLARAGVREPADAGALNARRKRMKDAVAAR